MMAVVFLLGNESSSRRKRPTQRAADGGYVPRFRAGSWREAFPCRGPVQPSPPPLTQTVGGRTCGTENLFIHQSSFRKSAAAVKGIVIVERW